MIKGVPIHDLMNISAKHSNFRHYGGPSNS